MKKIQGWVRYRVEVFIEVEDDATNDDIRVELDTEATDEFKSMAELEDIDYIEN